MTQNYIITIKAVTNSAVSRSTADREKPNMRIGLCYSKVATISGTENKHFCLDETLIHDPYFI